MVGPARQRFDPKHKVFLQSRIPWEVAKAVPEPRPTGLGHRRIGEEKSILLRLVVQPD
jgi:hypothetical protein